MAESVVLATKKREGRGSQLAKRLRIQGMVPAVIYGHKEETISISLVRDDLQKAIRRGARVVDLQGHGPLEKALIREIQWDHLGHDILHIDFERVAADERITVPVPLEIRGTAAGA